MSESLATHRSPSEAVATALTLCHAAIYYPNQNRPLDALMRVAAVLEHTTLGGGRRAQS